MTVRAHQGLGLLPKGLGSGDMEIPQVGRAGPSAAGASPTTPSEEAGQTGGQLQTQGIRHPHGDETGLKLNWEDKFTGQGQEKVLGTSMAVMQLQCSSGSTTCISLNLKQLLSKYGRSLYCGLFLQVASSVFFPSRQPAVLSLSWL